MEHEGEYIEQLSNRNISESYAIDTFMKIGWRLEVGDIYTALPVTAFTKLRRDKLSKKI